MAIDGCAMLCDVRSTWPLCCGGCRGRDDAHDTPLTKVSRAPSSSQNEYAEVQFNSVQFSSKEKFGEFEKSRPRAYLSSMASIDGGGVGV